MSERAAVNKGVLIALAIVAAAAAVFWAFRGGDSKQGDVGGDTSGVVKMYQCSSCKHAYPLTNAEWGKSAMNEKGALQCPKCQKWSVANTRMTPEEFAEAAKEGSARTTTP